MLRGGDDHRYHRALMQAGFKSKAMQGYLNQMTPQVKGAVAGWSSEGDKLVFPTFKQMTLDLAASIFIGMENLTTEALGSTTETDWAIKVTLRMYPPLSTLPKMSNTAFEYEGQLIPADALVITCPIHTHYMSEYWDNPETFDPTRLGPEKAEHKRHDYSWVSFSGSPHMCIGLHFANMQIKLVLFELLKNYSWKVADGYEMLVQQPPISKPRDDLPVTFVPASKAQ